MTQDYRFPPLLSKRKHRDRRLPPEKAIATANTYVASQSILIKLKLKTERVKTFFKRVSVEIVCPLIQVNDADPPSGTCTKNDLSYQTSCTFKCLPGYILNGTPVRQCQQDKTWSGSTVTCEGTIKCLLQRSIKCPADSAKRFLVIRH